LISPRVKGSEISVPWVSFLIFCPPLRISTFLKGLHDGGDHIALRSGVGTVERLLAQIDAG